MFGRLKARGEGKGKEALVREEDRCQWVK